MIPKDTPSSPIPRQEQLEKIRSVLRECEDVLSSSQKKVLWYRFGVENGSYFTVEEAARHFRVTPERIRQVERSFLNRFRYRALHRKLPGFLE